MWIQISKVQVSFVNEFQKLFFLRCEFLQYRSKFSKVVKVNTAKISTFMIMVLIKLL